VATSLGEVLRLPLPDGSSVTLNSASEVAIEMGRSGRLVRLLRGEALFDVALDALRPFVVEAARARVLASGTSFTVQRGPGEAVEVLVRQGAVDLLDASVAGSLRLAANTLARVAPGRAAQVEPVRPLEVSRRLSWRDGMLSFDGDTLAEAAAQFARYSALRLVIDDADTARRRVVGLYAASDPAGFARAVALSMGLRARRADGAVHLGRMDVQTSKSDNGVAAE
jgi:transmembrane sensor